MKERNADFMASDGKPIHAIAWSGDAPPKAVVIVVHGMCEYAARYERFAQILCDRGYAVYALDHRGHGKTASDPEELGFLGKKNGFFRLAEDVLELSSRAKGEHPGKPVLVFGHSMGSFVVRACIAKAGKEYAACVLAGTAGKGPYALGRAIAALAIAFSGPRRRTRLMNGLAFDPYSRPFRPNRTKFDWLSRDEDEVDAYVSDPLCGFLCTNAFYRDLFRGLAWINGSAAKRAIPKELPLLLVSGSMDPVGGLSGAVEALARSYRRLGIRRVDCRIYPEARHELLHETDREETMRYIADWMDGAAGTS